VNGLTADELGERIGRSERFTASLLADLENQGLAQETDGIWRLSEDAERSIGAALRGLPLPERAIFRKFAFVKAAA
jgi:hypothetical protein